MLNIAFNAPFQEQLDFFKRKLNLPTQTWTDIMRAAHDHAFVVAGAMQADLLADLRALVDAAINSGLSLDDFRKGFDAAVKKSGWQYNGGRNWRTKVIYLTNLRTSYAAGRWQQLNDPDLLKLRPYWRYVHSDDVLHPRPLHQSWDNLTLPADSPWWRTHYPPNDWGCMCKVFAVSLTNMQKYGKFKADEPPSDGTYIHIDKQGKPNVLPNGVGYGWDYSPGKSVDRNQSIFNNKYADLQKRDPDLANLYKLKQGNINGKQ